MLNRIIFFYFLFALCFWADYCWADSGDSPQKRDDKKRITAQASNRSSFPKDYPRYYKEYNDKNYSLKNQVPIKIFSREKIKMTVEFLGFSALDLVVETGAAPKIDGREAYSIQWKMELRGFYRYFYKIKNSSRSFFDAKTALPLRHSLKRVTPRRKIYEVQTFNHQKLKRSVWQRKEKGNKVSEYKKETYVPLHCQNLIGLMQFIRSVPAQGGKHYTLPVVLGKRMWMMQVFVERGEEISFKGRSYRSLRVKVNGLRVDQRKKKKKKKFNLEAWVSLDDMRRVLQFKAKTSLGSINGKLVDHQLGSK